MIDHFSPTLSYYIVQNAPGSKAQYAFGIKTAGYRCSYYVRTKLITYYDPSEQFLDTNLDRYKLENKCNSEQYKRFVLSMFADRAFILPEEEIFHLPICFTLQ